MWSLVLYIIAVVIGLVLYQFYNDEHDKCSVADQQQTNCSAQTSSTSSLTSDFRLSSVFAVLGISAPGDTREEQFEAFTEHFSTFDEVAKACWHAGLESSSLVIAVDFSASNEWKGRKTFNQNCLHKLSGTKIVNPYQKVISILGQTLAPFDDDNMLPAYGFGDTVTRDHSVFPFRYDEKPCNGFEEVLELYNEMAKRVSLSGPTSLAPIINKSISIVRQKQTYHILVIITDGQVTEESTTIDAVVEASNFPLSIIAVGVGDGPWDFLQRLDSRVSRRKFDNFRFVDYHKTTTKVKYPDQAFALKALMEIPDQYKRIKELGYLAGSRVPLDTEGSHRISSPPLIFPLDKYAADRSGSRSSPLKVVEKCRHRLSTMSW